MIKQLKILKDELNIEIEKNILEYWINYSVDIQQGGFYGLVNNKNIQKKKADKGCILNSRILWTFSAAYNKYKNIKYLSIAKRAYNYLSEYFYDNDFSGLYWSVNYKGKVVDSKKHMYNIAFGIYGLSEYYRASKDINSLELAISLFKVIEKYSYDNENKGYIEAFDREFNDTKNLALSDKDMNEKKSMNTHLHIMEAYTNLLKVWHDDKLKTRLKELIELFINKIIDTKTNSQKLFFDEFWNSKSDIISYGHDIEASWLLYEAVCVLDDEILKTKVVEISKKLAKNVFDKGIDKEVFGLYDEMKDGKYHSLKSWWPQAEAFVGFMYTYLLTKEEKYLKTSLFIWNFIKQKFIDYENGEWFEVVNELGNPIMNKPKISEWKCPYHNTRALLEVIKIIDILVKVEVLI